MSLTTSGKLEKQENLSVTDGVTEVSFLHLRVSDINETWMVRKLKAMTATKNRAFGYLY